MQLTKDLNDLKCESNYTLTTTVKSCNFNVFLYYSSFKSKFLRNFPFDINILLHLHIVCVVRFGVWSCVTQEENWPHNSSSRMQSLKNIESELYSNNNSRSHRKVESCFSIHGFISELVSSTTCNCAAYWSCAKVQRKKWSCWCRSGYQTKYQTHFH